MTTAIGVLKVRIISAIQGIYSRCFLQNSCEIVLALMCLGMVAASYFLEKVIDLKPCPLCLEQRYLYIYTSFVAIMAYGIRLKLKFRSAILISQSIIIMFLVLNCGIALFHSLVERHIVDYHAQCAGVIEQIPSSIEKFIADLHSVEIIRCDVISFSVMGLTLSNLNFLLLICMLFFYIRTLYKQCKWSKSN